LILSRHFILSWEDEDREPQRSKSIRDEGPEGPIGDSISALQYHQFAV
jgi:hypothetical protein